MRVASDPKQERINLRLGHDSKQMLERAASFEGKTVSNYILTSALAHAENTIRRHETMVLNRQDSELFLNALTKPAPLNENLLAALEEHSRRVNNK